MTSQSRLEIQLLLRAEFHHGVSSQSVIRQLTEELERPLPDVLPVKPRWRAFKWPGLSVVDLEHAPRVELWAG